VALASCSTEEPYTKPIFGFSNSFRAAPHAAPRLQTGNRWWQDFKDPTLNTLMDRALAGNIDLAIAREKVIEARANVDTVPSPLSLTPSGSANVSRTPPGGVVTRAETNLNFSWLLDPYGLRRQQLQVAGAQSEAANAEVDAARQVLTLNMAGAYVELRYYQKLMELRQQQLRSRRQAADLTQKLFDAEAVTRLDVVRTQALVAETQTQIPTLSASVLARKNEIAVLAGIAPDKLDINLAANARQPQPQKAPDLGIPADLLRNRPDIQIAELNYYAAVTEIGVARADLYPRLSLNGLIGQLLIGGVAGPQFVFGPALDFPSLLNDDRKAVVVARHSRAEQAHATWKATVLSALEDVDSAYATYQGSLMAVREANRYAQLQREARNLTLELVQREGATVRDLISAEENVADADVVLADSLRQLAQNFVQLNISLGAGSQVGRAAGNPVLSPEELMLATAGE
jgi:multidrug efflux system outer membrane protein